MRISPSLEINGAGLFYVKGAMLKGICRVFDLGCVAYEEAYRVQRYMLEDIIAGGDPCLLLCEHFPVISLGRTAQEAHILASRKELEDQGIQVLHVDRGGDVTVHCPGQLVAYPLLDLKRYKKDLKFFLSKLEQVAIDFLKGFDILGERISGRTGVWIQGKKIVSIGIGVKHWVTYHGMALNVAIEGRWFSYVHPCGFPVQTISLADLKGPQDLEGCKKRLAAVFCEHFSLKPREERYAPSGQTCARG